METTDSAAPNGTTEGTAPTEAQVTPPQATGALAAGALVNDTPLPDRIPEKFRTMNEDGEFDLEKSTAKLLESYAYMEKRQGSGEAPPKSHEEYNVSLDIDGFAWDEYKADPMTTQFLEGAHKAGLNNAQVQFVLGEYMKAAPELMTAFSQLDEEQAVDSLKGVWRNEQEFNTNISHAYRAAMAAPNAEALVEKFANDPDFIQYAAWVGSQMVEDTAPSAMQAVPQADFNAQVADLRAQASTMKMGDPRRDQIMKQMEDMYNKRYPQTKK
jgi:hypothetical protein